MNSSNKPVAIVTIVLILLLLCLCCLCIASAFGVLGIVSNLSADGDPDLFQDFQFDFPLEETPDISLDESNTNLSPEELNQAHETLTKLNENIVPINDPVELAGRLGGNPDVPNLLIDENAPYAVGDEKTFWVTNTDTNENFQVTATLRYLGENIYFWIENDVRFRQADLDRLASNFDEEIIPTNRDFFGMEWNPGVDGDPRFYVLYAGDLGNSLAGYYSSADELHPDAHPYSNAHEMFLINSDNVSLDDPYIYGTMAHEFQHMIHWYQDRNEETWVNEGFSMLAEEINGFDAGGFDWDYMNNTDMQLTDWKADTDSNASNYGASYLFMVYFLDRFGEDATKALVAHDENGFPAFDAVFKELNIINPTTGNVYTGNEFYADWAVANMLQNSGIENRRYDYIRYSPYSLGSESFQSICPTTFGSDVHQYGTDYITFDCLEPQTINFTGSEVVKLLPFDQPPSGEHFFWSNQGDESNMRLTREFDLSDVTDAAELSFKTWYDLETDYDYLYISATTDGENWDVLTSQTCTTENPSGNSYNCGWNGQSNGWIDEKVDLSPYLGKKVTLRFDYVTDAAANGKGMAIDDVRLAAIGYQSDFESDNGGWLGEGFVRVQNKLPQSFAVSVLYHTIPPRVEHHQLDAGEKLSIEMNTDELPGNVTLIISGTTPHSREKAVYEIDVH